MLLAMIKYCRRIRFLHHGSDLKLNTVIISLLNLFIYDKCHIQQISHIKLLCLLSCMMFMVSMYFFLFSHLCRLYLSIFLKHVFSLRFEMLKTADGSISGSLKVIESLKANKKNKGKRGSKDTDWTWKEQVSMNGVMVFIWKT